MHLKSLVPTAGTVDEYLASSELISMVLPDLALAYANHSRTAS